MKPFDISHRFINSFAAKLHDDSVIIKGDEFRNIWDQEWYDIVSFKCLDNDVQVNTPDGHGYLSEIDSGCIGKTRYYDYAFQDIDTGKILESGKFCFEYRMTDFCAPPSDCNLTGAGAMLTTYLKETYLDDLIGSNIIECNLGIDSLYYCGFDLIGRENDDDFQAHLSEMINFRFAESD